MFTNNLHSAFRNIRRNKFFSLINIVGLAIGLAGSFFLLLYILHETGYNQCYKNHKNIYRVIRVQKEFNTKQPYTPYYLSEYLLKDFPNVKKSARRGVIWGVSFKNREEFIPEYAVYGADPAIFDIFTLPVISGNKEDFLKNPSSVVISKHIADKYFPDGNALGKKMEMRLNNETFVLTVDGVIKEIPRKSTFRGQIICHIDFVWERSKRYFNDDNLKFSWNISDYETWILIPDGYNISELEKKMPAFVKKYAGKDNKSEYTFQALDDVYFNSRNLSNTSKWGDIQKLYIFALVALLILFIAATNYIILSTARSITRFKEIGIRKTIGATPKVLIRQIYTESIVTTILAVPLSVLIMYFSLQLINSLLRTNLNLSMLYNWKAITGLVLITVLVGTLSGSYLAVLLSRLNPVEALRNANLIKNSKSWLRFALITLQIIVFVVLLTFLQTITAQLKFAETSDLGFDTKNLLKIYVKNDFLEHFPGFLDELKESPNIVNASAAAYVPPYSGWTKFTLPHKKQPNKQVVVEDLTVDYDFDKTIGLKLLQGRSFSKEYGSDQIDAVIVSSSAIKALGLPENPVGTRLKRTDTSSYNIIGVVDDFYVHSFKKKMTPVILTYTKKYLRELVIRYRPGTDTATIAFLKKKMAEYAPDESLDYLSVTDAIKELLYKKEIQLKNTLNIFTMLAIFISMLGLFALSVFLIRQKAKSIGIRKVLGASTYDIIRLIVGEFLIMVVVANVIAIPMAAYISNKWLSGYAYHIGFTLQPYAIAFVASLALVFFTVVVSALRIARVNPAESVKYQG